jgi:glycine/D-amino acid oxidase-like deaminating enzyme
VVRPAPLTPGYSPTPYWWEGVEPPSAAPSRLSPEADVAVVGAGYTGLAAALELAGRGRHVVVFDRDEIGAGASSRNGGMVHPGTKHDLPTLLGMRDGTRMWDATVEAFEGLEKLIAELAIECDWRRCGHLELAHHPRIAPSLSAEADAYRAIGEEARFVPPDELASEIGSDRFHGGLLVERSGAVHPAQLMAGLARGAVRAGADVRPATAVLSLESGSPGFVVETSRGTMKCGEVVVATNGTTDHRLVPWLGRRILGVGSYIISTELLDPTLVSAISPNGRMFFDTRNFLHYWRPSPDGRRVLFGGRTSFAPTDVARARDRLYEAMVAIHPQLAGVSVDRAWGGRVALTVDRLPHIGRHPGTGVVYAMGYCGTGVALSIGFGRTVGRFLCGEAELPAFADRRWRPVPPPAQVPWLLPVAGWWYQGRDALGI